MLFSVARTPTDHGARTEELESEGRTLTDMLVVFTRFAREEDAVRAARTLVEERLVASVSILPGTRTLFPGAGDVADVRGVAVITQTRKQDWSAFQSRLHELHPDDVPECVAVRVAAGAPRYMEWLEHMLEPEGT